MAPKWRARTPEARTVVQILVMIGYYSAAGETGAGCSERMGAGSDTEVMTRPDGLTKFSLNLHAPSCDQAIHGRDYDADCEQYNLPVVLL